jgi:HK97 family phage major capsid protein
MKLKDLIAKLAADRAAKIAEHDAIADGLATLREAETPDEVAISEKRAAKNSKAAEIEAMTEQISSYEAELRSDEAMDRLAKESVPAAEKRSYDGVARIGQEKRTYRPDHDRDGSAFLHDLGASVLGDFSAQQRLAQHMAEERVERSEYLDRAVATTAFAGLVVPQYLTDLYAPATAALRPFADICTNHPLPADGMTVNISRMTTASSVALQTENAAASETNMDDTLLTINVLTAAGQQTVSRQAIDRGTGVDGVVLADLFARYATTLDSTLINQAATGLTNVAQVTAYTDASPTAAELYPKVLNGQANVEAALLGFGYADHAIMHSRRWAWMQSQVGTSWPFIGQPGLSSQQGGVNMAGGYGSGVRGILPNGMKVIVDNNIATNYGVGVNEDEIYIVPSSECHLWEDPSAPMFIRAEQPAAASLGVLFVVYGYFAYSFARYTNGTAKINGTGLVAPTF